jgi:ATP-dependent Lon protease
MMTVSLASASSTQLTVLAAVQNSAVGAYEHVHMVWDQKPDPPKLQVRWTTPNLRFAGRPGVMGGVLLEPQAQAAVSAAVRYAIERTPQVSHTGTITMMGTAYLPTKTDGPSAGAAMTVALMALFNGIPLNGVVCMTGTLEPGGRIGKVGAIPQKMRAARAAGCHVVLVPRYQILDENWDLNHEALQLGLKVREVETIDEAYESMTRTGREALY